MVSCLWPAVVGEVEATFGNHIFSHDKCNIFSRLNRDVEAQVDFSLKITKRTRVACYWWNSYERQFASVCTQIFSEFWRVGVVGHV